MTKHLLRSVTGPVGMWKILLSTAKSYQPSVPSAVVLETPAPLPQHLHFFSAEEAVPQPVTLGTAPPASPTARRHSKGI